ncbi:type I-B CRISPR-associated protein Cas5b [Sulfurihydrogenibium subterraneum]|uniref:type I-B CRISPR-associated protein Cas5b n=1 Tax=Sulfurihydrogenibium subterraneum TaxID=171121 RepID=UPI0004911633|nr:type I-B CRISPR-associated protein Cas5b [Sulfurihydrogenibium subterraneum]
MQVLVFDIWGDFGHFKKFYTTSSPLTFSIPPPTSIFGMIGAVLGLDKNVYLKYINANTSDIAIQIINPVKKTRITLNYIDTKENFTKIKNRTQIRTEFLKNPHYRLYINLKDESLFRELKEKIQEGKNFYTLSLGLANLISNFRYVGLYEIQPLPQSDYVNTVILNENIESIEITEGKRYFKEKIPLDMEENRIVRSYKDVVMELKGDSIEGRFKNVYKVENKIISFLKP